MPEINWALARMPDAGATFTKAFEDGKRQRALEEYARNPESPQSINALLAYSPEVGLKAMEVQRKVASDRRDASFGDAAVRYYGGGRGTHAFAGVVPAREPAANALTPAPQVGPSPEAMAQPGVGDLNPPHMRERQSPPTAEQQPPSTAAAPPVRFGPDNPHTLGVPQTDADHAFLDMLQIDPKRAFAIDSEMRDNGLKLADNAYSHAISRLANVTGEDSYQQVINEVEPMLAQVGYDVRANVPAQYPGPEGVRQLLMTAMDAKDQVHAHVERERLDAYTGDIEADNERADRNTNSVISDRSARTGIARTAVDRRDATARRGQDLRDATQRRGQDTRDVTQRRGQDTRGSSGSGGVRHQAPRPTATGANGEKYEYDGKSWVKIG